MIIRKGEFICNDRQTDRVATRDFEGKYPEEPFCFEKRNQWDSTQPFWNINLKLTGLTENVWWVREPSYERGRVLRHPYSPDLRIGLLFRKCLFQNAISMFYSNFSQIRAGSRYWGQQTTHFAGDTEYDAKNAIKQITGLWKGPGHTRYLTNSWYLPKYYNSSTIK